MCLQWSCVLQIWCFFDLASSRALNPIHKITQNAIPKTERKNDKKQEGKPRVHFIIIHVDHRRRKYQISRPGILFHEMKEGRRTRGRLIMYKRTISEIVHLNYQAIKLLNIFLIFPQLLFLVLLAQMVKSCDRQQSQLLFTQVIIGISS